MKTLYLSLIAVAVIITIGIISFFVMFQEKPTQTNNPIKLLVHISKQPYQTVFPVMVTQVFDKSYGPTDKIFIEMISVEPYAEGNIRATQPINATFNVVDSGFLNLIDLSRASGDDFFNDSEKYYETICVDSRERQAHFVNSVFVPITPTNLEILVDYSYEELIPNQDGVYHLKFASFFPTVITLPPYSIVLSNSTETCQMKEDIRFSSVTFYDVSFRF